MKHAAAAKATEAEHLPAYLAALDPPGMSIRERHHYRPENNRDPRLNKKTGINNAICSQSTTQTEAQPITQPVEMDNYKGKENKKVRDCTTPQFDPTIIPKVEDTPTKSRGTELERLLLTSPTPFNKSANLLIMQSLQATYNSGGGNGNTRKQLFNDSDDDSESNIPLQQLVSGKKIRGQNLKRLKPLKSANRPYTRRITGAIKTTVSYADKQRRSRSRAPRTSEELDLANPIVYDDNNNNNDSLCSLSLTAGNLPLAHGSDITTNEMRKNKEEDMPCCSSSLNQHAISPTLTNENAITIQAQETQMLRTAEESEQKKNKEPPTVSSRRQRATVPARPTHRGVHLKTKAARAATGSQRKKLSTPKVHHCGCGIGNNDEVMLDNIKKANKAIIKIIESIGKIHRQCRETNDNIEINYLRNPQ
nr:uncharacterized protein LOC121501932 [Drosophila kikkawai]XP_041630773.1 uncharacterized protein LOC121502083 [Drosophila kikkawai]